MILFTEPDKPNAFVHNTRDLTLKLVCKKSGMVTGDLLASYSKLYASSLEMNAFTYTMAVFG